MPKSPCNASDGMQKQRRRADARKRRRRFCARSIQTCPGPSPPRGPRRSTAAPRPLRNSSRAGQSDRRSLLTRCATRAQRRQCVGFCTSRRHFAESHSRASAARCCTFSSSARNCAAASAFAPSESAFAGSSCTSRNIPSMPAAAPARASGLDKFRLPAGLRSPAHREVAPNASRQNHRIPQLAHDRKRPHIHHQILIAKRNAALRENNFFVSGGGDFLRGISDSHGERNCPFFKFTRARIAPRPATNPSAAKNAGICRMSHTSAAGPICATSCTSESIGTPSDFLIAAGVRNPAVNLRPAKDKQRRPIRLVIRSLENVGHAQLRGDRAQLLGHAHGMRLAFDHAGARNQKQGRIAAQANFPNGKAMCSRHVLVDVL